MANNAQRLTPPIYRFIQSTSLILSLGKVRTQKGTEVSVSLGLVGA